jgi:hypothetical protein
MLQVSALDQYRAWVRVVRLSSVGPAGGFHFLDSIEASLRVDYNKGKGLHMRVCRLAKLAKDAAQARPSS